MTVMNGNFTSEADGTALVECVPNLAKAKTRPLSIQ